MTQLKTHKRPDGRIRKPHASLSLLRARLAQATVYGVAALVVAVVALVGVQTNNVEYAAAKPPAAHSDSETPERASVVTTEPPGSAAGKVDAVDLSLLMARMGQYYPPADLNSDGIVSQADVSYLQGAWTW